MRLAARLIPPALCRCVLAAAVRAQDVKDNAEEASLAAPKALQLCKMARLPPDQRSARATALRFLSGSALLVGGLPRSPHMSDRLSVSARLQLEAAEDWEAELESVLDRFQGSAGKRPLYNVCFY